MQTSKTKSMTGIIIALSVLLVLSLTATIALAYFSASQTASTTITFDNGITLTVTGIEKDSNSDTYFWLTDKESSRNAETDEVSAGSSPITLQQIDITVTGAPAYVAVKANIANTGGIAATPDYGDNWIKFGDWYVYGADAAAQKLSVSTSDIAVKPEVIGTAQTMNQLAGAKYVCTLAVHASDTLAGLAELTGEATINPGP